MNIDERLDRLTERHEALTQTVELLAQSQQKNEVLMAQVLESINSLARIAHTHEQRISNLESHQK
jgi:flagellar biosynthesis/type III secretory pathway chaperone